MTKQISMVRVLLDGAVFDRISPEPDVDAQAQALSLRQILAIVRGELPNDRLIVQVSLNGQLVGEDEWEIGLAQSAAENSAASDGQPGSPELLLEIWSAPRFEHLSSRLGTAALYLRQISAEFSQAAHCFKSDESAYGNAALATAVDNFLSFVHWYTTLLLLDRETHGAALLQFYQSVERIHLLCEELVGQQMFENHYALGALLHSRLEPALHSLEQECAATLERYQRLEGSQTESEV